MSKMAWVKLLFDNRRPILSLTAEGIRPGERHANAVASKLGKSKLHNSQNRLRKRAAGG